MNNLIEIQNQINKLQKQASDIKAKEFDKTIQEIVAKMQAFGITLKDLQNAGKRRGKSTTVTAKARTAKVSRSSSLRATICCRAAFTPFTKLAGEELAKRVSAGAASWAKREAAYFEWRMVISWKSSTPQRFRFWHTARR